MSGRSTARFRPGSGPAPECGLRLTRLSTCASLCCVMFGRCVVSAMAGEAVQGEALLVKKTTIRHADGRELIYYDARDDAVRDATDPRPLDPVATASVRRLARLLGDRVP